MFNAEFLNRLKRLHSRSISATMTASHVLIFIIQCSSFNVAVSRLNCWDNIKGAVPGFGAAAGCATPIAEVFSAGSKRSI